MPLLNGPHDNEATAALSITRNRANKIDKLIDEGNVETARTFAAALLADVLEWTMVGKPGTEKAGHFIEIAETAFQAYVRARDNDTAALIAERERLATSYPAGHNRARRNEERIAAIDAELIERAQK